MRSAPRTSWKRAFLITADIRYPGAGYGGASGILALLLVFSFFDARWLRSLLSAPKTPPIELQFPLAGGRFAVVQGGNDSTLNHHAVSAAQRYAIDIVSVGAFGMRASAIVPTRNGQYYAYGRDVLAPCDGHDRRRAGWDRRRRRCNAKPVRERGLSAPR